ncbi:MAG: hypothetical protein WAM78_14290 [Candidatus Sulfotelmatobacter sp.]
MKSLITVPCACGKQIPLEINGSQLPEYANCPDCCAPIYLIEPLGNIVTMLLMVRAKQELTHHDITISTLLSAVAVEAEMAYLEWKAIESQKLPAEQTPEDRRRWENEWANMRSIGKRLDELSRFLTTKPFDEFARQNGVLLKSAMIGHNPGTSIKDFLQEQLFDRRNDIAHYGKIDFQEEDGIQSMSLATALLNLLHAMDMKRYDLTFPKK